MSTPDQPSTSGPNRRRSQRFKRGGHQTQLGSHTRVNISQLLHRKGQTHDPPDTYERSLAIGRFNYAPLNARIISPHVYPAVGQRREIDNDCLYIHYPSRRLDFHSPLALRPITTDHSPDLINKMYLTVVHSTDSATTIAFMIHLLHPRLDARRHRQHHRRSTR
jgi:hypothetical protein